MYRIKFASTDYSKRKCGFCGSLFETGGVVGYLAAKDRQIFLICEKCLKAGIKEFPSILKHAANQLKEQAAFLEDLSNQKIEYSEEEYEKLKREVEQVEENRFGVCPECRETDGYLNIGRNHWFVCHKHKKKWCIGFNLFSSWQEESKEDWERNAKLISDYEGIEEFHPTLSIERLELDELSNETSVDLSVDEAF
jgi:hypothetical protein